MCDGVWSEFSGFFFCFKQKTAYEMRISDGSSDVCSSDLLQPGLARGRARPLVLGTGDGRRLRRRRVCRRARQLEPRPAGRLRGRVRAVPDRKSVVSGKSVSVRVDLGGRRIIKKTRYRDNLYHTNSTNISHHPSKKK